MSPTTPRRRPRRERERERERLRERLFAALLKLEAVRPGAFEAMMIVLHMEERERSAVFRLLALALPGRR
jgi:hypothetical protein